MENVENEITLTLNDHANLAQAEEMLIQFIQENASNLWPDIDRSPEGCSKRLHDWYRDLESDALEGYPPPKPGSLFARLMRHIIAGDITPEQAMTVKSISIGISHD